MKLSFLYYSERRIIYDYEKFGDSPTCLGETNGIAGLEALGQGKQIIVQEQYLGNKQNKLWFLNTNLNSLHIPSLWSVWQYE